MASIRMHEHLAHPLGVQQIIIGDVRERVHPVTGKIVSLNGDGQRLYKLSDPLHRPWFVLAFESGKRIAPPNADADK